MTMKYDNLDKQIMRELISLPSNSASFSNIFDKHFCRESLQINHGQGQACFVFNTSGAQVTDPEINEMAIKSTELTILLARYMNLYRFLDKEGLVFFYMPAVGGDEPVFIGKADALSPIYRAPLYDDCLRDLAWKYCHTFSIPSPALKELVAQGFVDDEERRYLKSLRASWVAIFVSLALGLAGIVMNITNSIDQDSKFSRQIEASKNSAEIIAGSMKQLPADFLKLLNESANSSKNR